MPSGSWWRSSHILSCNCGSCWCGWSSSCFRCCARLVCHQQRQEASRSSRRRSRSSSDGTGRAMKKRHRGRSPSPGRSSRCREKSYRSSSESSEDDRAEASSPMPGRAPGGTPGNSRQTSLASIYGLMSETSLAFHLPTSLLMRSLLDDTKGAFLSGRIVTPDRSGTNPIG